MYAQGTAQNATEIRALVPYQPPKTGLSVTLRRMFSRLFMGMDKLFLKRKRIYLFGILLLAFGVLAGSYFGSSADIFVRPLFLLHASEILLPIMLLTGMTVFGIAGVPLCLLCISFLCGCAADTALFSSAQGILYFGILSLFLLSLLLFSAEAFLSARRSLHGWKTLFVCRSFVAFLCLFLITFLLEKGTVAIFQTFIEM